ncbi:MAG: NAD(P)H-dependent flavin oxidoreductase [Bacteroides sp.]
MFVDNRLCQLLGISLPIIQGGMIWCSGWQLVSAVSSEGGLGVLGSGSMTGEELRVQIRKVREKTSAPFGVNVPLLFSRAEECVQVCFEERIPVLITSAGSAGIWTERAHALGMKVGHVVANVKFATKAEAAGVDFLVCEGVEAGGHNGLEELSTLVLTQMLVGRIKVPLVSAGGYMNGYGLAAALALGADGIQMGSRFACTVESAAGQAYKQHLLRVGELGTVLTSHGWGPTRVVRNAFSDALQALERSGASVEAQREYIGTGRSRRGMVEGDLENGELEIGQIAGAFTDVLTVSRVMEQIVHDYQDAVSNLQRTLS